MVGNGFHFGFDGDELFFEGVEFVLDLFAVVVTRFQGVDENFDGGGVDHFGFTSEFIFVFSEGDSSDHHDVLGTFSELDGK